MAWRIEWSGIAERQLQKLDAQHAKRIFKFVERLLSLDDPRSSGEALRGRLGESWKYRVGSYRLICKIEDDNSRILVLAVGHRKEIYR